MRFVTRAVVVVGLLATGVVLAAAPASPAPRSWAGTVDGEEHEGEIFSFGITVPDEPITVGDTIVFPNNSDRPHTITDRGATFDTGEIAPGTTDSVTFETPGNYEIFCQINPSTMNALVVVEPGADPPPAARIQLYDEFREGQTRRFDPDGLDVDIGDEITVANVGGLEHTLTAEDGSFDIGPVTPGEEDGRFVGSSETFVADEAGEFAFFCEFHPDEMQGVLRVVDPDADEDADEAAEDEDDPPDDEGGGDADDDEADGDEAAGAADEDDGTDAGALLAAVAIFVLGAAAIVVALIGKKPTPQATTF